MRDDLAPQQHAVTGQALVENTLTDLLVIVDMPSVPGDVGWRRGSKDDRLLRAVLRTLAIRNPAWATLRCSFAYAIDRACQHPQPAAINGARARIALELAGQPKCILAMGDHALKALGIDHAVQVADLGLPITHQGVGGTLRIVPTFSARSLVSGSEKHFDFGEHLRHALTIATAGGDVPILTHGQSYHPTASLSALRELSERHLLDGATPVSVAVVASEHRDRDAKIAAVAFAWAPGQALAVPLEHRSATDVASAWEIATRVLASPRPKIVHDASSALVLLQRVRGHAIEGLAWDTLVAQHLLSEELPADTDIDDLAKLYLRERLRVPRDHGDLEAAAHRADVTFRIAAMQQQRMAEEDAEDKLRALMATWAIPVSHFLAGLEHDGIAIDHDRVDDQLRQLEVIVDAACTLMREIVGRSDLNPDSAADLAAAAKALGLTDAMDWTTEALSAWCRDAGLQIDAFVAALLARERPSFATPAIGFAAARLVYSKASTVGITPLAGLRRVLGADDRARPGCQIHGTVTGRLTTAGGGANLQGLPHDEALREGGLTGISVRDVIRSSSAKRILVQVDVKAAEIRCLAAYTQDPVLVRALIAGQDPHCAIACDTFGGATYQDYLAAHEERFTDRKLAVQLTARRAQTKGVVFGTIYGATDFGIARQVFRTPRPTDAQVADASRVRAQILARLPSLLEFEEQTRREVNKQRYVVSLLGRRRRFPQLALEPSADKRAEIHRQALNFKVQSLASDLVVGQLAELYPHLGELDGTALLTVHDAGLFEVDASKLDRVESFFGHWITQRAAERYPWLPVPLAIDVSVGDTYARLRPISTYA